jgi:hypothetical protein
MSADEMDLAIGLARRARVLGRLAADLKAEDSFENLPQVVRDQLDSLLVYAEARQRMALWELDRIAWALSDDPPASIIAMKGCAYELLGLPNVRGRLFVDVDLMLPEEELETVESRLNRSGWRTRRLSAYDDNYYRKWTHELPPLVHEDREVEIDLHHNLLPRTARLKPPAAPLLTDARQLTNSTYKVLSPPDMVLHAMVHLFVSDEMADKLRDLVDIDDLLRHFSEANAGFWQEFLARSESLGLQRPAYYGVHYAASLLGCPVPGTVLTATRRWAPPPPIRWLMDRFVPRALYPPHPEYPSKLTGMCRWLLFVRSHWIRMPPWLLVYHLAYKFYVIRFRGGGHSA